MFIGRQVTAVCRRCPPATRSPTTTSDQPASSSLVYFLLCLPASLCIFSSPLDPLRDHRLWWTTPLAEKCAVARSKSDFSARLPEQSDAVWTCKKSSHSIFVLIYNDIYHFLWSNKMVSKRDTHFTIDTTYRLRVSFTLSREEKDQQRFFLRFRFTKTRKCPQISAAAVFESSFFLDRTLVVGLRAFSLDSNLSGCGAQCRFTTCSNVSQDKKTTAEGY